MATTKEDVIEFIANISVLDLLELVKEMEEKFGVSAAAAAVAVAPAAGGDAELQRLEQPEAQGVDQNAAGAPDPRRSGRRLERHRRLQHGSGEDRGRGGCGGRGGIAADHHRTGTVHRGDGLRAGAEHGDALVVDEVEHGLRAWMER